MVHVLKWKARTQSAMPDTLDGCGSLTKPKCGVCGKCVVPGNDHKNTKRVGRREVVYLPLNKSEGVYLWMRPTLSANFLVFSHSY